MKKRLYIEECHKGIATKSVCKNYIDYSHMGYYYDKDTSIGIIKIYLDTHLRVGETYAFTFEENDNSDLHVYMVLSKNNKDYCIAEYYDNDFYKYQEAHLSNMWMKCDAFKTLGINRDEWIKKG